jgi:hypothetical protein
MECWMAMFLRNLDQMDKAFELLKDWRFGTPTDDDWSISSCIGAIQELEIGQDGNNQK